MGVFTPFLRMLDGVDGEIDINLMGLESPMKINGKLYIKDFTVMDKMYSKL